MHCKRGIIRDLVNALCQLAQVASHIPRALLVKCHSTTSYHHTRLVICSNPYSQRTVTIPRYPNCYLFCSSIRNIVCVPVTRLMEPRLKPRRYDRGSGTSTLVQEEVLLRRCIADEIITISQVHHEHQLLAVDFTRESLHDQILGIFFGDLQELNQKCA